MATQNNTPLGLRLCCSHHRHQPRSEFKYRTFILVFTFFCYTAYHLSRKPLSVVKNVLSRNCTSLPPPPGGIPAGKESTWCEWEPFAGPSSVAEGLLGTLDTSFLFAYAIAMFFSGFIAERVNLRYFLAVGMLLSGIFTYLFGLAHTFEIHSLWYFLIIQIIGGIVQSTGWPSVVTCIGNWFGKGRRGFIFGVWNSHTSVGNILGSLIAGYYVDSDWGMSFILPGLIIGLMGFLVFLYLPVHPLDIGCSPPDHHGEKVMSRVPANGVASAIGNGKNHRSDPDDSDNEDSLHSPSLVTTHGRNEDERSLLLADASLSSTVHTAPDEGKAIPFTKALRIPGVVEFSLCLFFAKLVSYTFLYWLPRYIKMSTSYSPTEAANLSTLFDVGGIIGGIVAGIISDQTGASASTCATMLFLSVPLLFVYETYGAVNLYMNIGLLMACGLLVNGPYALITTAVSAELGTHRSLRGNSKALATVTSIIDGTGSMGAAVGPLLAGLLSSHWSNVFYMLMISDIVAMALLFGLVRRELYRLISNRRDAWRHHQRA